MPIIAERSQDDCPVPAAWVSGGHLGGDVLGHGRHSGEVERQGGRQLLAHHLGDGVAEIHRADGVQARLGQGGPGVNPPPPICLQKWDVSS